MGAHHPGRPPDPYADLADVAAEARAGMLRTIEASGGWDADPSWRTAFAEVPRHLFVPSYWIGGGNGHDRLRGGDPDPARRVRWMRGAYVDAPLATRLRDGELLSSSSQPSLMARMLAELRVGEEDRVLEIGAGTGYNAALLAHRVGEERVTTVDLDPEITASARAHLHSAGYAPTVVTGDGALGCPERAPFDRIVATCTLPSVPRAWLAQCAPGALVLAPLATGLIRLVVDGPEQAEGRFLHTSAYFVPLRGAARRTEAIPPGSLPRRALHSELFQFLLALTAGVLDPRDALGLWLREGRPARERYGVTVRGPYVWSWLDDPEGPYAWPLPEA
ncbi:methyltransferase domain-containing protein [Streptomyces sp. NPDC049906]|uniref:methyltransferase domain-containing protein n=1 Tax=Streptomyces sp. NPDC049906 TaxID=3155656 RepID=UPI0034209F19